MGMWEYWTLGVVWMREGGICSTEWEEEEKELHRKRGKKLQDEHRGGRETIATRSPPLFLSPPCLSIC